MRFCLYGSSLSILKTCERSALTQFCTVTTPQIHCFIQDIKSNCVDASASKSAGSCRSESHSSSNKPHAVTLRAHGKAKEEQIFKYLKANSPCFHEVQDVLGLHTLLLSVIFMGQEMEFDFVEAMFVLLALHTQGFLYLNFLQDLQKPQVGILLL